MEPRLYSHFHRATVTVVKDYSKNPYTDVAYFGPACIRCNMALGGHRRTLILSRPPAPSVAAERRFVINRARFSLLILFAFPLENTRGILAVRDKSSAVAEMGDRLVTIDMGRKVERGCCGRCQLKSSK